MIDAFFVTTAGTQLPLDHAPGALLRIHRNEFHYHPDRPPAVHGPDMRWRLDGQECSLFRLDSPVRVQFERDGERSQTYGPVRPVFVVEGILYEGDSEHPIGHLVSDEFWKEQSTGEMWTSVVFAEAIDAPAQG